MTTLLLDPQQAPVSAGTDAGRRWTFLDIALLIVVLSIALAVRLHYIDPAPSFDELWHMATTNGLGSPLSYYASDEIHVDAMRQVSLDHAKPIWWIWTDMRGVLHPPLFLISLRAWRSLVGESTFAAHLFSITWSLVTIVFLFMAARLTMDRVVATLLALTFALAQTQVYFAQEIRPYAMLIALGSIAVWMMATIDVLGPSRRRSIGLALMTLLLVLTHYFALGAALAIGLFGVVRLRGHRRVFLITIAACAGFFLVAWAPIAMRQTRDFSVGDSLIKMPQRDLVFTALMVAGTPFRLLAERDYQIELTPVFSGVLFVLPWMLIQRFRPIFAWVLWLCCTMGCLVLLDLARTTRHVAYARYLAIASPAVPLLFAGAVWPLRRWLAYVVSAVICFTGFVYLLSRNIVPIDAQSYEYIATIIAPKIAAGEPVIASDLDPAGGWRAPVWIMTLSHEPGLFPRTMATLTKPMTAAMIEQLRSKTLWLICDDGASPEHLIPGGRIIEHYTAWESISIYRIELAASSTVPAAPDVFDSGATRPSR